MVTSNIQYMALYYQDDTSAPMPSGAVLGLNFFALLVFLVLIFAATDTLTQFMQVGTFVMFAQFDFCLCLAYTTKRKGWLASAVLTAVPLLMFASYVFNVIIPDYLPL